MIDIHDDEPDWKNFTNHTQENINGFFGQYRWLSNHWICGDSIPYEGMYYPTVENAYMAAKLVSWERYRFTSCTPQVAKKIWRNFKLLDASAAAWDARKLDIMKLLVMRKFTLNDDLRDMLVNTGDKHLEETNTWKDTFYGVDVNLGGENHLGKILMQIREYYK